MLTVTGAQTARQQPWGGHTRCPAWALRLVCGRWGPPQGQAWLPLCPPWLPLASVLIWGLGPWGRPHLLNVPNPVPDVVEGLLVGDVVDQHDALRGTVSAPDACGPLNRGRSRAGPRGLCGGDRAHQQGAAALSSDCWWQEAGPLHPAALLSKTLFSQASFGHQGGLSAPGPHLPHPGSSQQARLGPPATAQSAQGHPVLCSRVLRPTLLLPPPHPHSPPEITPASAGALSGASGNGMAVASLQRPCQPASPPGRKPEVGRALGPSSYWRKCLRHRGPPQGSLVLMPGALW